MALKVYLDTSVIGILTDPGYETWKQASLDLLARIRRGEVDGYVSDLTLREIDSAAKKTRETLAEYLAGCPLTVLSTTREALQLADEYVLADVVPEKYRDDALHLAIASVNDLDAVVSWNFGHMVNLDRKRRVHSVNVLKGLRLIDIVSPLEVAYGQEENGS